MYSYLGTGAGAGEASGGDEAGSGLLLLRPGLVAGGRGSGW